MSWSLNEVESLARKAARGSGLSWGLADEAGKTTRWLASYGLPGPRLLAALLTQNDGAAYDTICPVDTARDWQAQDGALCPLIAGAALCDHAAEIAAGRKIKLGETSYPMLLVPYVAGIARLTGKAVEIRWGATQARIDPQLNVTLSGGDDMENAAAESVVIHQGGTDRGEALFAHNRGDMSAETARTLNAFAHRTYAPDTPESRLAGAGAGLTDND